jgi:hypothetical protein
MQKRTPVRIGPNSVETQTVASMWTCSEYPEDRDVTFSPNVVKYLPDYTVSHPKTLETSEFMVVCFESRCEFGRLDALQHQVRISNLGSVCACNELRGSERLYCILIRNITSASMHYIDLENCLLWDGSVESKKEPVEGMPHLRSQSVRILGNTRGTHFLSNVSLNWRIKRNYTVIQNIIYWRNIFIDTECDGQPRHYAPFIF